MRAEISPPALWRRRKEPVVANLAARIGALAALTVASLLVARFGGPAAVGAFVLLRVLPWVVGVITSCGLFGAAPYFLAGDARSEPRYRPTLFTLAVVTGVAGAFLWLALTPILHEIFFPTFSQWVVGAASITVLTQLLESTAKACSQGFDDLPGANRIIVLEELLFLPGFVVLHLLGVEGAFAVLGGLVSGDLVTLCYGWLRLARRGFFRDAGSASLHLAREVLAFGFRGAVGSIALLLNARLDFVLVGAIVGPAQLGIYAVASRFAELLRLPPLAVNYVLYPDFARDAAADAAARARSLIPRAGTITAVAAIPLALLAGVAIPLLYGPAFQSAVPLTRVLLIGLSMGGVSGVITAYLFGRGRPGLSSVAQTAGLVVTVTLDLALIPRFGVMGAAVASCVTYLTVAGLLVVFFLSLSSTQRAWQDGSPMVTDEPVAEARR